MTERNLFHTLFAINFFTTLTFGACDALFSLYLVGLGARGGFLACALALYAGAKCLLSPLMGRVIDRHGAKRPLLVCLTAHLLISLGYLVVDQLGAVALLRLAQGGVAALFRPLMLTLLSDLADDGGRGRSLATFDLGFYAALALGPLLGGVLADRLGFASLYTGLALLGGLSLMLAYTLPGRGAAQPLPATAAADRLRPALPLGSGRFHGLLLYIFVRTCCIALVNGFLPLLLTRTLGLSTAETGVVMAQSSLMMLLCLRPFGSLSDRCSRPLLMVISAVGVAVSYLSMAEIGSYAQALATVVGLGALSALSQPVATALLLQEGERLGRGRALGLFHFALNLGFIAGPLLGGAVMTGFGLQAVFVVAGGVSLVSALPFLWPLLVRPFSQPATAGHKKAAR